MWTQTKFPSLGGSSAAVSKAVPRKGLLPNPKKHALSQVMQKLPRCNKRAKADDAEIMSDSAASAQSTEDLQKSDCSSSSPNGKMVFSGTTAGLFKVKYNRHAGLSSEVGDKKEKIEALERKVKEFFVQVDDSMKDMEGIDLTMRGYSILGQGLWEFVINQAEGNARDGNREDESTSSSDEDYEEISSSEENSSDAEGEEGGSSMGSSESSLASSDDCGDEEGEEEEQE